MMKRWIAVLTSTTMLFGASPVQFSPRLVASAHAQAPIPVQIYSAEQLDAILAPIALYPDPLLTQILMAAAYPDQLAAAAAMAEDAARRGLRGAPLEQAVIRANWDPSVKSLVPFPQVLSQLSAHQDWAQQLAYAVAVQQPDVLGSVQRLRQAAWRAGHLRSTPQLAVRMEGGWIYVEATQPQTVFVPVYNPTVVYGTWAYPNYPPVYYPPPPNYVADSVLVTGIGFAAGVVVASALWDISRPRWQDRNIWVNTSRYNHINTNHPPMRAQRWTPPTEHIRDGGGYRPPPRGTVGEPLRPAHISRPGGPAIALQPEPGHGARGPGTQPGRIEPRPPGNQGGLPRREAPLTQAPGAGPAVPAAPPMARGDAVPRDGGRPTPRTMPGRMPAPTAESAGREAPAVPAERQPSAPGQGQPPRTMPLEQAMPAVPTERAVPTMPPAGHMGSGAAPSVPSAESRQGAPQRASPQQGAPQMGTPQGGSPRGSLSGGGSGGSGPGGGSSGGGQPPPNAAAPQQQQPPRSDSQSQRPGQGQEQQGGRQGGGDDRR